MKVGINEAQALRQLAAERGYSFANLLRAYVLEDFMSRLSSCEFHDCLWLLDDGMLGEAGCRRGGEDCLFFYYQESGRPFPENMLVPGQKLSLRLANSFLDQMFAMESGAGVSWQWESECAQSSVSVRLTGVYKEMKVPLTVQITALCGENQRPERRVLESVTKEKREIVYWKYSTENQLGSDLFQIMERLELIGDMGAYYRTYQTLLTLSFSGRHIVEELARLSEKTPQVKNERRLVQLQGYREYAYMRRRWDQYIRRHGAQPAVWEEALDQIVALITPIWQSLCRNEIFFDDWMPELGRYM